MTGKDPTARNAAGIADAVRTAQLRDHDGDNRLSDLLSAFKNWERVMDYIAQAGETMERFRENVSIDSAWGTELPSSCDAWSAIGEAVWEHGDRRSASEVAIDALEQLLVADRENDNEN